MSRTQGAVPASAVKMAVFTVVTLLLLGLLATLIGNISFSSSRTYYALFTDATGVVKGDRVRLAGVEVGSVKGTTLVKHDGRTLAKVEFVVESEVPVYRDAELQLRYENIVGQRYVLIEEEPQGSEDMPAESTFGLSQTSPALNLTVLFNGFQPLFRALEPEQLNRFAYQLVRTLQGESGTYEQLASSTAGLTNALADRDQVIGSVIDNLNTVLGAVDRRDRELTQLIIRFRNLMAGLAQDRDVIGRSLPGLAALLDNSAGIIRDVRRSADLRHP